MLIKFLKIKNVFFKWYAHKLADNEELLELEIYVSKRQVFQVILVVNLKQTITNYFIKINYINIK